MYPLIQDYLFGASQEDAEVAHIKAIRMLQWLQRHPAAMALVRAWYSRGVPEERAHTMCGVKFPNRIGMAAGFDKHAEVMAALAAFGFGFIEVGAILPYAQPGRERPRVFRLRDGRAIINRMGFNSVGAEEVLRNWQGVPAVPVPVIVNMGKMAKTPNERAADDYLNVMSILVDKGDMLTANISSPNTDGLRDLQTQGLRRLIERMYLHEAGQRRSIGKSPRAILVKLAPDLTEDERAYVVDEAMEGGASGFILSNTHLAWPAWVRREHGTDPQLFDKTTAVQMPGGYSGEGTHDYTLKAVAQVRRRAPSAGITAVGGLDHPWKVQAAVDQGADLVQMYTPLISKGPDLIRRSRIRLASAR